MQASVTPSGFNASSANGISGNQQVGSGTDISGHSHALLWSGTAGSAVDLTPSRFTNLACIAYSICGNQQAGWGSDTNGDNRAILWSGTASSAVLLIPSGYENSDCYAYGVSGTQQVGEGVMIGSTHAFLWSGTSASVDLGPGRAFGVYDNQQVGIIGVPAQPIAALWAGTSNSVVSLNPNGYGSSAAYGTSGQQQVGVGYISNDSEALLWSGNASNVVDLGYCLPSNYSYSVATGIDATNGNIIGYATYIPSGQTHAILWIRRMTITPLRVSMSQANVSSNDPIDNPIEPWPDANILSASSTPLGLGVVADGVTPVLFKLTGQPGNYSLAITNNSTAYKTGTLSDHIYVLKGNHWMRTTNFTITSSTLTGITFAYLEGLDWNNFTGVSGSNEITAQLSVTTTGTALTSTSFEIRPPPVALVHGYNADSTSWSPAFLQTLYGIVPTNFVIAVNYGTNGNNTVNSYGQLEDLAPLLDAELYLQVEEPLHNDWDFTRYDLVCHSQGGVLVRMLCQNLPDGTPRFGNAPAGSGPLLAVVGPLNNYRGRFRRVITIGSPHNGSLILHYLLSCLPINPTLVKMIPVFGSTGGRILQKKFDPFGLDIAVVNSQVAPVDPRIRFNCISATIASGQPPSPNYNPSAYVALGLCQFQPSLNKTAGQYLLPRGSDGIVDFDSQTGGMGTVGEIITNTIDTPVNITHANVLPQFFGVGDGQSETSDPRVASIVTNLLAGPTNAFGPFILPKLLSANQQALVDSLIPLWASTRLTSLIHALPHPNIPTTNFNFQAQLPVDVPSGGIFGWDAEVYGTNGLSSDGVSLQVNTNDSSQVTVSVNTDIVGTVVLYAYYGATNGTLIVGDPMVVYTQPAGDALDGISLDPTSFTLPLGGIASLDIWGNYSNGLNSLLYLTPGSVLFSSSNTNVATVDTFGTITVNAYGSASISAQYNGFIANCAF